MNGANFTTKMMKRPGKMNVWRKLLNFTASLLFLVFYNEFLIYYIVLLQCQWPILDPSQSDVFVDAQNHEPLKVMMLADTHLLGMHGHWFDKLRREWQMRRSFQASMTIHSPEVVFILGDALDEGMWSSDSNFKDDVKRFKNIFSVPTNTDLHVVVGNHDIGFHYSIDERKRQRFTNAFGTPSVRQLTIRGNMFILVNSMAMEGDGCSMCSEAEQKVQVITKSLRCAQNEFPVSACKDVEKFLYSKPILLQHFPMYRESLSDCTGPDEPIPEEKFKKLKPKMDCLSKDSTQKLLAWLSPRFIVSAHTHYGCYREHENKVPEWTIASFNWRNINQPTFILLLAWLSPRFIVSAHTHYGCYREHENKVPEWTIASFNWRNINQPTFILARVSPNNFAVNKCYMPRESTVIFTYVAGVLVIFTWFFLPWRCLLTSRTLKTN